MRSLAFLAAIACLTAAFRMGPAAADNIVSRPELAPGTTFVWHSLEDSSETFLGYVDDQDCPAAPCSRWLGLYWAGTAYFFEDADLNIFKRERLDGTRIATPYVKRMRFPADAGSTWRSHFRNAAGWEIDQTVTVVGWEEAPPTDGKLSTLHLHAVNHRLNGSPYLGSAAWFTQDYFMSQLSPQSN